MGGRFLKFDPAMSSWGAPAYHQVVMAPGDRSTDSTLISMFQGIRTVALTTFRRDGSPVTTPVSITVDGDRLIMRTWRESGKFKRISRDNRVKICISTFTGEPLGQEIKARALTLDGEEAERASRAISRSHPILHRILIPLGHRLRGFTTVHLELIRADHDRSAPESEDD